MGKATYKYKIGDIVQLKSGGPDMTVVFVSTDGSTLRTSWFSGKKNESGQFPDDALVPASPKTDEK